MHGANLGGFYAHGLLFTSHKMQKICHRQKKVSCFPEKACNHFVCLQLVLMDCVTDLEMLQRTAAKLSVPPDWEEVLLVLGKRVFSTGYRVLFLFSHKNDNFCVKKLTFILLSKFFDTCITLLVWNLIASLFFPQNSFLSGTQKRSGLSILP